jgi:hypothetical protein
MWTHVNFCCLSWRFSADLNFSSFFRIFALVPPFELLAGYLATNQAG